jgi:hypothetical protein
MPMFITECGYIDQNGFGSSRSHTSWHGSGCAGPDKFRWKMITDSSFDKFGRMDLLSKYAVAAVELLGLKTLKPNSAFQDIGISLGTEFGSFEVDISFIHSMMEPTGGSPILFPYTLPSTAIGEIAIRHCITGPSVCFMAGADSGLLALWESFFLVKSGQVNSCIGLSCDVIYRTAGLLTAPLSGINKAWHCHAFACLIENEKNASACVRPPLAKIDIYEHPVATDCNMSIASSCSRFSELYKFLAHPKPSDKILKLAAPSALRKNATLVIDRSKCGRNN